MGKKGFTFLELLIALSIFSVIAIVIYSSFNVGIRVWKKAEDSYKVRQDARYLLSRVSRDLRCAVNFVRKDKNGTVLDSFEGNSSGVSFWKRKEDGIFKSGYFFDAGNKTVSYILQTYKESFAADSVSCAISSEVLSFTLQYAYMEDDKVVWKDKWDKKDADIPMGVKIRLSYPARGDASFLEWTQTVSIPVGTLKEVPAGL